MLMAVNSECQVAEDSSPLLPRSHVARIPRPPRAVREQRVLGRQYLERKTPQSSAYCTSTRAKGDDNPRLGGALFMRELAMTTTPSLSRGAYFRMGAPQRSAYSAPYPRYGDDNPRWVGR